MIMSIDQSLSCSGVTIWDGDELMHIECIKTPPKVEVILRIRAIVITLKELVKRYGVTVVVIEQMAYGAQSTSVRMLAGLYYMIENMCMDLGTTFAESHITRTKKLATTKGNAKKDAMMEATEAYYPGHFKRFVDSGVKKTTGLADLCDSLWIYKLYQKDNDDK